MNWRDFLYFSKGEQRALFVLLSLILISCVILFFTDKASFSSPKTVRTAYADSARNSRAVPISEPSPQPASTKPIRKPLSFSPKPDSTRTSGKKRNSHPSYPHTEKYPPGTLVELNTADTATLKKIPGIGSAFASRIVKYRNLLGGFYTVRQLSEVYGIDEDKFQTLAPWFSVDTAYIRKLTVNRWQDSSFPKHPYLDFKQVRVLKQLKRQKGKLTGWENLVLLEEFAEKDRLRLRPYLSFE